VTEVRDELRAISRSSLFVQSRRRIKLLEYLCNMMLLGRQDEIKESTIALEVFGRTSAFDDKKDAIVRVDAHRLRERLAKYYATEGIHDRVVIELAPGSYVPRFVVREPEPADGVAPAVGAPSKVQAPPAMHRRFEFSLKWKVGVAALLAFALGVAVASSHRKAGGGSAALAVPAVPPIEGIRILAGSNKPYIDRAGRHWRADQYFRGGAAQPGPLDFLGKPPDPSLFRSMRYGEFSYDIPAPPGVYELRLHFAEPTFRSGTDVGSEGGENQRHFTVAVNGEPLLYDLDVVSDSGMFPVDVRAFRDIRPATDGLVHLSFQAVAGPAFVNAIELLPGTPGRAVPIRIRAGNSSFTDHSGNVWDPDDYYVGGRLATHKGDVTGTPDPDLYAAERYGNFSYAIPVPPGRYAVTLHFAETFWDPAAEPPRQGAVASRVFNVSCNGTLLLPEFDILKEAKPFQAVSRTFHNLRPNGQGKLLLSFSPIHNYALVKAIEVKDEQ
jgi:hypothetical protein